MESNKIKNVYPNYRLTASLENKTNPIFFVVLFFIILTALSFANVSAAADSKNSSAINCDIHNGPCVQTLSNGEVVLDIHPKPVKAMSDLTFKITLVGKVPVSHPYIDLGMPGMDMGPNRVYLKPIKDGEYEGTGIIVRCPSGRRTWYAKVTVPDSGTAEFIFNVVY